MFCLLFYFVVEFFSSKAFVCKHCKLQSKSFRKPNKRDHNTAMKKEKLGKENVKCFCSLFFPLFNFRMTKNSFQWKIKEKKIPRRTKYEIQTKNANKEMFVWISNRMHLTTMRLFFFSFVIFLFIAFLFRVLTVHSVHYSTFNVHCLYCLY